MAIIVALAASLLLFFVFHKHTGVMHLAMIAGLSIYEMFGDLFVGWAENFVHGADPECIKMFVYAILVVGFPLLLFLKSSRGGFHGIFHLAEAVITAIVITTLAAEPLAYFFSFDNLSTEIFSFIKMIEEPVVVASILTAYLDILLPHRL